MDLGTELRTARERAGLSLPDLAARTRIPLKSLRAIEENDFVSVPPGIFARSFIRTYAREVGLDPSNAVAEFRALTEPVEEPPSEPRAVPDEDLQSRPFAPNLSESRPGWGYALIAAALLIGIISVNRYSTPDEPTAPPADASTDTTDAQAPVATSGSTVQIQLRALRPCWVRAVVDGDLAFARLMTPGDSETLTAHRDITLRVGDPGALFYSINGRAGPPLGEANVPVTVSFGSDGRMSKPS
jgi:hypothetical protein